VASIPNLEVLRWGRLVRVLRIIRLLRGLRSVQRVLTMVLRNKVEAGAISQGKQDDVDLAIVLVPAGAVPQVLKEVGRKGCKGAVVISAGFKEIGGEGIALEQQLKEIAQNHGITVIGPNCLGIYDPYSGMDTLFLPEVKMLSNGREVVATPRPLPGNISLISQSGGFGVAALDYMAGARWACEHSSV
jgi:acyl-CoA synthetase (NDP forming)